MRQVDFEATDGAEKDQAEAHPLLIPTRMGITNTATWCIVHVISARGHKTCISTYHPIIYGHYGHCHLGSCPLEVLHVAAPRVDSRITRA